MTILSKDAILGARDIQTEDVDVPEWGGTVRVAVMSGLARDNFIAMQEGGKQTYSQFQARIIVVTAVDEAGQPLFTVEDIDALRAKSKAVLDRLTDVAVRINKMEVQAVEEAGKNSDAAPSGDSGSSSPSTSASQ